EEIYTAILPIGDDELTIESLPDGELTEDLTKSGNIIFSKSAVETFGKIVSVQTWDDVTEASNLQTKAMEQLAKTGVLPYRTISVTALDLHFCEKDIAEM